MANIDLFTPRTMLPMVQEATKRNPTWLRDTFFRGRQTFNTPTVEFDVIGREGREMAAFVNPDMPGEAVQRKPYRTKTFKAPELSPLMITTAEDGFIRMPGEELYSNRDPMQRVAAQLGRDLARLDEMITRREESMCAEAIFTGKIVVKGVGYNETIVSVPIINGGIVATQIMTSAALEHGMNLAAALGAIVYAVQKFVGTPIASYYGIREARVLIEEYRRAGGAVAQAKAEQKAGAEKTDEAPAKPNFFESHKKYYGVFVSLAITAFFAWVAFVLGKWTGLASSIWALILGTLVSATGMLPKNILKHSNSSGIFNVFIFATIIPSLAQIRLEDLSTLAYALVVLFVVTCAVLYLFFYVLPFWKLLGSRNLAMGVSVGQLLGFPATYLIVNEVAKAVGENEAEMQYISDHLMPKYLVSGFATVTSCSVIMAGIFQGLLQP